MTQHLGACYWGYNKPGCFLWATVLETGRVYVRADFKFLHKTIEDVASSIRAMSVTLGFPSSFPIWADPEMFSKEAKDDTVEVEPPAATFARFGVPMSPAGGERTHGWQRIHEFLRQAPDGMPWLVFDPACTWLARTLPTLTQTKTDADDCEGEDYAANALRFLLASRPAPGAAPVASTEPKPFTLGWFKAGEARAATRSYGPLRRPA